MVGSLETGDIAMVAFTIHTHFFQIVRREWCRRMAVVTGNAFAGAAAVVTAHAVGIFRRGAGGVMMACATVSDHIDMSGVVELNRSKILAQLVNLHLGRRCCGGGKRW